MRSSMRQWRRLVLVAMFAWVLLFLGLLSYFLDTRVDEPLTSASSALSQHPDTRRLASLQGSQPLWSAVASSPRLSSALTAPAADLDPDPGPSAAPTAEPSPESSQSPDVYTSWEDKHPPDYLDPQSLAAWSSFGTENVAARSDPLIRSRERGPQTPRGEDKEDGGEPGNSKKSIGGGAAGGGDSAEEKNVDRSMWPGHALSSMLSPRLKRAMRDYLSSNKHHVNYRGRRSPAQSSNELLCQLKHNVSLMTVDGSEQPFSSLGWASLVPQRPIHQQGPYATCAVVTSAGAILGSGLGKEIDSHEAVLRFNAAPTDGYKEDVGNKTTIRIINSQILADPRHHFNTSSLFKNVILVAWDPAPYTINLHKWYTSPDYNLFGPYVEHRKLHPSQSFYVLHPKYVWKLWDVIQGNNKENIQPNPPSSGFIGILLMMALCKQVHVYEYIPSVRQTDLCHYHERYYDAACTLGAYHPLLYEKSLVQQINIEPEREREGRAMLPGFSTINCTVPDAVNDSARTHAHPRTHARQPSRQTEETVQ